MATITPVIIDYKIFEYLIRHFKAHESIQIFDLISNSIQILIENLIPRINKPQKVKVSQVTKENYDQALFVDQSFKSAKHESRFISKEERSSVEFISKYFPNDAEERVKTHKLLEKNIHKQHR
jgi:hypothetical protein